MTTILTRGDTLEECEGRMRQHEAKGCIRLSEPSKMDGIGWVGQLLKPQPNASKRVAATRKKLRAKP